MSDLGETRSGLCVSNVENNVHGLRCMCVDKCNLETMGEACLINR
jgi:hypothetical protein